jgi:hypothetical protein
MIYYNAPLGPQGATSLTPASKSLMVKSFAVNGNDGASAKDQIGLPGAATILLTQVSVVTGFNGTTPTISIGKKGGTGAEYISAQAAGSVTTVLGSLGLGNVTDPTSANWPTGRDVVVTSTVAGTGVSTGLAYVTVYYTV